MKNLIVRCIFLLLRIDFSVLFRIERISWWIQSLAGWDCFHLRDLMNMLTAALYADEILLTWRTGGVWRFAIVIYALMVAWFIWRAISGDPFDQVYRECVFLNHRKTVMGMAMARLMTGSIGLLAVPLLEPACLALLPMAVANWLDACNPMPPGISKIRKWIDSLTHQPQPSLEAS